MLKKSNKKKGFTLTELLAVIVILAVIMVVAISTIIINIDKSKEQSFEIIENTLEKYLEDNYKNCSISTDDFPKYDKEIFDEKCELIENNLADNLLKNSGYDNTNIGNITINHGENGDFDITIDKNSSSSNGNCLITSIIRNPNHPELPNGLVPIKHNGNSWISTTSDDPEWYDYNNQKWANAAKYEEDTITAMYVWIPRFSYTIGCHEEESCYGYRLNNASDNALGNPSVTNPGAIDIKFINLETKDHGTGNYIYGNCRNAKEWYTHPTFTQNGKELSGIWIGKFEVSGDNPFRILPSSSNNYLSSTRGFLSGLYTTSTIINSLSNNLSGDLHIIKNSEWSAASYLSQSVYGKYGNENYNNKEVYINGHKSYYTGIASYNGSYLYNGKSVITNQDDCVLCGTGASTTGNIYGIYDMSGGTDEAVYVDTVTSSNLFTEVNGWYDDSYTTDIGTWITRGGNVNSGVNAGIFAYSKWNGSFNGYQTIRVAITN